MAYGAIISSDWNECLAPCGPFDVFAFHYPHLDSEFRDVFKQYTGNVISLSDAVKAIRKLVPEPITPAPSTHTFLIFMLFIPLHYHCYALASSDTQRDQTCFCLRSIHLIY